MNNGFFVLDVDGHVTPDVDVDWTKYMSAAVAAEVDEAVGGKKSAMTTSRTVSDELRRQGVAQGRDPYPKRTGGWDPKARLADLDLDGIDTTVLFPTLVASGGTPVPSPLETTQGYHNWLAEFCSTNSERLKGVASIPLIKDIGVATTEVRRCVEEFGFVGISVRVHQYGRTLANTDYTELFAAADELDIPVMVHLGSRVREWFMEELNYSFTEAFGFGHPASSMIGLMDIIFGGWLETLEVSEIRSP